MSDNEIPVICLPKAIPTSRREHYAQLREAIFQAGQEVRELDDGYGLRLPLEDEILLKAAEFITLERLCCPFLNFRLEVTPSEAWLALTGSADAKALLQQELGF